MKRQVRQSRGRLFAEIVGRQAGGSRSGPEPVVGAGLPRDRLVSRCDEAGPLESWVMINQFGSGSAVPPGRDPSRGEPAPTTRNGFIVR